MYCATDSISNEIIVGLWFQQQTKGRIELERRNICGEKNPHYLATFQEDPKETEPQGVIPKICWITRKHMFVTKVVTASEQEWRNGVKEPTPPLPSVYFHPLSETQA